MISELSDIRRRLENIVRIGRVAACDYQNARVRVRIGEVVTNWLPWLTTRAGGDLSWWAPEEGEQVLVFSPSGETALGVCLPSIYQSSAAAPSTDPDVSKVVFSNGSTVEHNRATGALRVEVPGGGLVKVVSGGNVSVEAVGEITLKASKLLIDAPIEHTGGDIETDSNVNSSAEITASGVALTSHIHSGVESGTKTSGPPV